jgi:hypothetical protein
MREIVAAINDLRARSKLAIRGVVEYSHEMTPGGGAPGVSATPTGLFTDFAGSVRWRSS